MRAQVCYVALALALAGCSQTYNDAMKLVCESPKHATEADANAKAVEEAKWLRDHLKNEDVTRMLTDMAGKEGLEKLRVVSDAVAKAGISEADCPFLTERR